MSDKRLAGKVALVTGASRGIGAAIAVRFAADGAKVVVNYARSEREANDVVAKIVAAGGQAVAVQADVGNPVEIPPLFAAATRAFGRLDILVNNAANTSRGDVETTPLELWDQIMAVNLRAPFLCLQEAVKSMKARGGGSIVNIGSINAYVGSPRLGPYAVSKGALMTLTRNAACALNRYRIRVNQLNVGWTMTEGEDVVQRKQRGGGDWLDDALATRPFGRLLTPQEIAYAAAYFASDESALITGAVLDMEQTPPGAYVDF